MEILLGFNDFYQATQQFMEQYGGVCQTLASQETVSLIPERFGQGKLHDIQLREGLDLLIHNLSAQLRFNSRFSAVFQSKRAR